MLRFISYRKTQREDWLIFEAIPYTNDIGVHLVGAPGQGYTTGLQFGRADTEEEAEKSAKIIAQEHKMVLVPWEPPGDHNPQFVDLPRQFPKKTEYISKEEAEADGWIYINPSKVIEHYRGRIIKCVDVTPGKSFGYKFAVKIVGQGYHFNVEEGYMVDQSIEFALSQEIWVNNYVSARFRAGEVVDAILDARKWIDGDLLSISEAANLTNLKIWKISQLVQSDKLAGYYPNESRGRGRHGAMVSQEELRMKDFLNGQ